MTDLEKDFHQAMLDIYFESKKVCGTNPVRFLSMVANVGGAFTGDPSALANDQTG